MTADTPEKRPGPFTRLAHRYQYVRHNHRYGIVLRYVTIVVGVLVTAVGIVTIPYPGPGWAVVFVGLLILSQELEWAARLRHWIMEKLNRLYSDHIDGNRLAQAGLGIATCAIVLLTLWLTGALSLAGGWVGLDWAWLSSPFSR
ncbi:MAG: TIGR02611 family protein [Gordonia sp. (in: high G+C Gram-positive bacteria)]|uniref:TIGR02611 family protein n=1 Tax=Gordonia sp. (in: high G+C Gram-positive bacteria) TaxID=84139 RepID=UPI0039E2CC79